MAEAETRIAAVYIPFAHGRANAPWKRDDISIDSESLDKALRLLGHLGEREDNVIYIPTRFYKDIFECNEYRLKMEKENPMFHTRKCLTERLPFELNNEECMEYYLMKGRVAKDGNSYILVLPIGESIYKKYESYFKDAFVYISGLMEDTHQGSIDVEKGRYHHIMRLEKIFGLDIIGKAELIGGEVEIPRHEALL